MTAIATTLAGRELAEVQMQDACTIVRPGPPVLNEQTLQLATPTTTLYVGKCRVSGGRDIQQSTPQAGDRLVYEQSRTISVPMTVLGLQVDDVVTVTASALDPDLIGRVFHVRALEHKTHLTARRLLCEETVG